jgi:CubicO group peptidase (beta-lactamase class C family)
MEARQVKIGLYAFLVVLLVSMFSIKPYLPKALYHNFAKIDDYTFFENRTIAAKLPGEPWQVGEQKMPAPDAATEKLLADLNTTALLVLENGKIVYERYDLTGGQDVISGSFSMAKSIVAILYGFALQDGRIKSLNEPISNYLGEWEGTEMGKITIKNLLTMSSGLNWQEAYSNPFSITTEAYYGSDLRMTALRQQMTETPGSRFSYQSGNTQLLGMVLGRAVNMNLSAYASAKLWKPLGAEKDALWSLDHENGQEKAFCCINASARDFARIGQLILQKGKWHDEQLLNSNYIDEMLTPNRLMDNQDEKVEYYGYQWWLLKTDQGTVPYMRGILGQYVMIIPSKNRVVVRLGKKMGDRKNHHPVEVEALAKWAQQ